MWDGGKGWEKAVHMPSCVTYVREEHLIFVKWTLTYILDNGYHLVGGEMR